MVDISNDQPSLASEHTGTVKDLAATHQALDTMGAPPGPAQQGPGAGAQGAPISNPPQPGGPGGPTQPMPPPSGTDATLDPSQIFDQTVMSRMNPTPPFRVYLKQAAENHPLGNQYLQQIADQVKGQKGPLY